MPAEIYGSKYQFLARPELLTFEEIVRLVGIFVELGVTKVRLTGGEPLVRSNLEMLVSFLSNITGIQDLTLTTNGYLLENRAKSLKNAGLQRITVSLDSLDEDVFSRMNGRGYSVERVLKGIHRAQEVNLHPIKINCVVQKGVNDHTIVDLARFCKARGYIARFIEYMDVGTINGWKMEQVVSADEIAHIIGQEMPLEPILESYHGKVAQRYRYRYEDGEIGIIASVTKPFCGACTRARLSTNGKLYTCLFAGSGRDLMEPLRSGASDTELRDLIASIWAFRVDRYSEERSDLSQAGVARKKIEMYQIGG
jgi:cyclic pyranopterin phosphate synthase